MLQALLIAMLAWPYYHYGRYNYKPSTMGNYSLHLEYWLVSGNVKADLNYYGIVNFKDYAIWSANFR